MLVVLALAWAAAAINVGDRVIVEGTTWELTWQDDFSGPELNASNWNPADNYTHGLFVCLFLFCCIHLHIPGDQELELYLASNVYVQDDNLVRLVNQYQLSCNISKAQVLRTMYQPTMYGTKQYEWTSGWVDTQHKFWQQFGRFEINARLPSAFVNQSRIGTMSLIDE